MKAQRRKFFGIGLTLAVVLAVLLSGPAQAITLGVRGMPASVSQGDTFSFLAQADLHDTDFLPEDVTFRINIEDSEGQVYMYCDFGINGYNPATDCENFDSIVLISTLMNYGNNAGSLYGYGYGYGYGELPNRTQFTFPAGPGYGPYDAIGYGYFAQGTEDLITGSAELVYNVTMTLPDGAIPGVYKVSLDAILGEGTDQVVIKTLNTNKRDLTVTEAEEDDDSPGGSSGPGGPGGPGGSGGLPPADDSFVTARFRSLTPTDVSELVGAGDLVVLFAGERFTDQAAKEIIFGSTSPLAGQRHTVVLKEIRYSASSVERSVVIEIYSEPRQVIVYEGQSTAVDVDGDDVYDLVITVDEITASYAIISVNELSARAGEGLAQGMSVSQILGLAVQDDDPVIPPAPDQPGEPAVDDTTEPEKKGGMPVWLIIVLVLVVIAVVGYFLMRPREKAD